MTDEMEDQEPIQEALNDAQEAFCREYLIDFNGTQAAIRAGYSEATAAQQASRLLRNVKVAARLVELREAQFKRLEIQSDDILKALHELATSDIGDLFTPMGSLKDLGDMTPAARRTIQSIEVHEIFDRNDKDHVIGLVKKIKFWDKPKSLELLGKNKKLFTDKVEHTGTLTLEQLVHASTKKGEADE